MHISPIVIIAGPTASGKTSLALELADTLHGEIINADSMQLYQDLPTLSACPSKNDKARCPHHLFQQLSPSETCSAGKWLEKAAPIITSCLEQRKTPLVVGGTGLYLKALIDGLAPIPAIPPTIKEKIAQQMQELGPEGSYHALQMLDPERAAEIHPKQQSRIQRALEILETTGISQKSWQKETYSPIFPRKQLIIVTLLPDRLWLYQQCDARFDTMIAHGALEEIQHCMHHHPDLPELPLMRILGAHELYRYIQKEISLDEAITLAKRQTRRYAKRQYTWFRHQIKPDLQLTVANLKEVLLAIKKSLYD